MLSAFALVAGCASHDGSGASGTGGASSAGTAGGGGSGASLAGSGGTVGMVGAGGTVATGGTVGNGGRGDAGSTASGGGPASNGSGGSGTQGAAGAVGTGQSGLPFSYWLGVDVSWEETKPPATRATLIAALKAHGINSIRLRTFVDPKAADGYDTVEGSCDLAHTIAFGKQVKAAGMGFLLDFHYSDTWADPGHQCVPIQWQSYTTIADLAKAVHDYTKDAITQLIAGGARPDMVQIGNETTPGMLIQRCQPGASGDNPVNGKTANWVNLGALLKAGVDGVKEVDPKIMTALHIDRGGDKTDGTAALATSITWFTNALKYTTVDAFGESSYQTYQGDASNVAHSKTIWQTVESGLAAKFPNVKIFAAEIGSGEREINDVNFGLPNQTGIGTFFWEATRAGEWNTGALLSPSGGDYVAQPQMALYDQMKIDYASRL
jgi:arabinogalactan endo-1,4-beta-galactosidase